MMITVGTVKMKKPTIQLAAVEVFPESLLHPGW